MINFPIKIQGRPRNPMALLNAEKNDKFAMQDQRGRVPKPKQNELSDSASFAAKSDADERSRNKLACCKQVRD